ncbi:hypothetical protein BG262_02920 [Floricoccus penangensis]|uniref:Uncharacterized protein n=1 Tax=Floricoccus penangensis TaxID=1859475 RepID=A0A9Q5JGY9_9LACT|nr:hypothetical protein [Floricoccus penangensis]OFI46767.1 hypothetical protein BG262_02920 [Floricoccus penangensis]
MEFWNKILEVNSLVLMLGFGGIGAGFKWVISQIKALKSKFKNLEYANVAILHDKIYSRCNEALRDGWISVDDLENLEYLWKGYKNLGGNGTGETIYKKVLALPNLPIKGVENG